MHLVRWKGIRVPTGLLAESPRPAKLADIGRGSFTELIPQAVVEQIRLVAEREHTNSTNVLIAAFATLIHRYTRECESIPINISILPEPYPLDVEADRDPVQTGTAIVTLTDDISARDTIRHVREATSAAFADACLPCLLTRSSCSISLGWTESDDADAGSLRATLQTHNGLVTELSYERLLANSEPVLQTGSHWQMLLSGLDCDPATPISALPILGPEERNQILQDWRGSIYDGELTRPECLHQLFEAQASVHPERIALICGQEQMTYGELDQGANQLARYLRAKGIGAGCTVGLFLPRSMDVYLTLLAILKAGAAYVPIDSECPPDRAEFIFQDCGVEAVVTTSVIAEGLTGIDAPIVRLDAERALVERELPHAMASVNVGPSDLAYIIYTSGSTGRPKGVQIEHRSVCNLVRAEGRLFRVLPTDRVYQGFSIAFDASVEEVWLAFFAGATLVVGTSEMIHAGPALAAMLAEAGITVLSCVPTLLSMMDEDIPTLRLLIFGGEACPEDLATRWSREGRRVVNTYGPTEATVIATCADCRPGEPITIGRPVPNYSVYVLDDHLQPVPVGVPGELHLGGVGLSRGYVGRDDLTAEKFVPNPFGSDPGAPPQLYKTGDLVRFTSSGNVEFLGRTDTQVKIRGFRVEPTEIECVLRQCAGVQGAVVAVRPDVRGIQQIVGYVVPKRDEAFVELETKAELRSLLPSYMVPSFFVVLDEFPTLSSGKIDRKALPPPKWQAEAPKISREPASEIEARVLEVWEALFFPQQVSVEDDFFDLGGHSLLAARMVSELRKDPKLQSAAMLDVYHHPKLEDYARELAQKAADEANRKQPADAEQAAGTFHSASRASFAACSIAQIFGLYMTFGLFSLPWLSAFIASRFVLSGGCGLLEVLLVLEAVFAGILPALMLISAAAKWILIGRYKEGSYPLWGFFYWRFWLVRRIEALVPLTYLRGTPLLALYCRLMGANIGRNVYLGSHHFCAFDLVEIGDDSSIGMEAELQGYTVEGGMLRLGRITVGKRCYVGAKAVLSLDTMMEDDSKLDEQSMIAEGTVIPDHEAWAGSPARLVEIVGDQHQIEVRGGRLADAMRTFAYALSVLVFLPAVPLVAGLPGGLFILQALMKHGVSALLWSPLAALSFVVLLCLEIAALKWILIGHVRAGKYSIRSGFHVRKWFVDALMQMSLLLTHSLYATLYLAPWFRLLGARLGKRVEISTAGHISPDLLSLGAESFVADSACLGAARVHLGYLTIEPTSIGRRTFVGNSALVPPSAKIGDGCLIGCMSVPPSNMVLRDNPDSSWLGSPPVMLPRRQESEAFPDSATFCPPWYLYIVRGFIEFWRVTLPTTLFILLAALLVGGALQLSRVLSTIQIAFVFPVLYFAACAVMLAVVAAIKWAVIGRYKPCTEPLWCHFVWRTELVTAIHESFTAPFLLNQLQGTPFISWCFRLLGSQIGKRVFMDTTQITEFDMVQVGDDVALNVNATLQTHLFEDRIMKVSRLKVGDRASVGTMAVVLYDSEMEEGASLGGLSLLMKGETLPACTRWEGIPARRAT